MHLVPSLCDKVEFWVEDDLIWLTVDPSGPLWWGQTPKNEKNVNYPLIISGMHLVLSLCDKVEFWFRDDLIWPSVNPLDPCGMVTPPRMKKCELPFDYLSNAFSPVSLQQRWVLSSRWPHMTLCGPLWTPCGGFRLPRMKKCEFPFVYLSNAFSPVSLWQSWVLSPRWPHLTLCEPLWTPPVVGSDPHKWNKTRLRLA